MAIIIRVMMIMAILITAMMIDFSIARSFIMAIIIRVVMIMAFLIMAMTTLEMMQILERLYFQSINTNS